MVVKRQPTIIKKMLLIIEFMNYIKILHLYILHTYIKHTFLTAGSYIYVICQEFWKIKKLIRSQLKMVKPWRSDYYHGCVKFEEADTCDKGIAWLNNGSNVLCDTIVNLIILVYTRNEDVINCDRLKRISADLPPTWNLWREVQGLLVDPIALCW